METKCKTVPARRAGKSKKLPARVKICLPDMADNGDTYFEFLNSTLE